MAIQCQFTVIIAWFCFISLALARNATRGGVSSAPVVKDSAEVEFYILEASFPYNAPSDIKDTAGENFRDYGVTHGGLGVWDKSKDVKFTIEFISSDYVGALLPKFNEEGKTLVWSNIGQVVFTTPIVESDWLNSQLVSETTGVAYNQLVAYIRDNEELFDTFQPVEADHYNSSSSSTGTVVVSSTDSFWFVRLLIGQLSDYGADTSSFMEIHATAFQYIAQSLLSPAVVAWSPNGPTDPAVYGWYQDLSACYQDSYSDTKNSSGDAKHFLQLVKQCYGAYAYIYLSDTSVYNLSLANVSSTYSTPDLQRYLFLLPDSSDKSKHDLQPIDLALIAIVALGVLLGAFLLTRKLCCTKPKRRRLSLDGERVAERTVDSMVGARLQQQEGHEEQVYYKISSVERWTRWTRNMGNFVSARKSAARSGTGSSGDTMPRSLLSAVLTSERQPNSSDSDPSSDLVRPLAGQRLYDEHSTDLQYLDRVVEQGGGGGYVSPALSTPLQHPQEPISYAAVAMSALEAEQQGEGNSSSSAQQQV